MSNKEKQVIIRKAIKQMELAISYRKQGKKDYFYYHCGNSKAYADILKEFCGINLSQTSRYFRNLQELALEIK